MPVDNKKNLWVYLAMPVTTRDQRIWKHYTQTFQYGKANNRSSLKYAFCFLYSRNRFTNPRVWCGFWLIDRSLTSQSNYDYERRCRARVHTDNFAHLRVLLTRAEIWTRGAKPVNVLPGGRRVWEMCTSPMLLVSSAGVRLHMLRGIKETPHLIDDSAARPITNCNTAQIMHNAQCR